MASKGWVKIHRSIMDNDMWLSEPFTKAQAWIDLIMLADHEDMGDYKKGCVYKSVLFFSERWKWSRGKVRRFLSQLSSQEMIQLKSQQNGHVISLVKYGFYQNGEPTKKPIKKPTNSTTDEPHTINKEINKPLMDSGIVILEDEDEGYMDPMELLALEKAKEDRT